MQRWNMKAILIVLLIVPSLILGCAQSEKNNLAGIDPGVEWSSRPRVLAVIYNPVLEADDDKTLVEYYGWNNPDAVSSATRL